MLSYFTLNNALTIIGAIVEIMVIWVLFYICLKFVRNNTRTIQIFKGILIVVLVRVIANFLHLNTITALVDTVMTWGVVAIIIIFQPEIRNGLEKMGQSNYFTGTTTLSNNEKANLVDELVKACDSMSKSKTGALISIEQGQSLNDYVKTGTSIYANVSSEIICSIFQYGTPLHDGALIIQGAKIACAATYFPPTSKELSTSYGARHRAAVGISEISDCITIIVSEESGKISIAQDGKLTLMSIEELKAFLIDKIVNVKKEEVETNDEKIKPKVNVFENIFKAKKIKKQSDEKTVEKLTPNDGVEIVDDEGNANTIVLHYEKLEEGSESNGKKD